MATGSVFSETLKSITTAKLSELSNKRATFDARHSEAINTLQAQHDPLSRVVSLLNGVKHCFNIDDNISIGVEHEQLEDDVRRLDRFLEQARFDPSLTGRILSEWEKTLTRHLDTQSQRYQYATLYGQLVTEWLSPGKSENATATAPSTELEMGDSFNELPSKKRLEAREQFEMSIFTPADVNEDAVKQYLDDLFSDEDAPENKTMRKAITALRESTQEFEAQFTTFKRFDTYTVDRSITGLLKGELFAGEKRTVLKNFRNNNIILAEIADVLNMRMSALSTWSWGSDGVPIEQRRKLNGRFDIFMHEDLLQAIFLQFIGVEWSVFLKDVFGRFRREAWKSNFKQISRIEKKRREYYLGPQETDEVLARMRRRTYRKGYFLYHLLDSPDQEVELKDGEEEAELVEIEMKASEAEVAPMSSTAAMMSVSGRGMGVGGAMRHRRIRKTRTDDEESDDDSSDRNHSKKPMERKQDLLHLLATEAAVSKREYGTFTAFRGLFDDLQNTLPHQAITMIMRYFGVSQKWLSFFHTYLQAPLRFLDDEESDAAPRKRQCGAPASHTLSDVLSEAMLFCVDFSVNQRTNGSFLYRLADDFWFWSPEHSKASTAWQEVLKFAETMGLSVNEMKSGSVSIQSDHAKSAARHVSLPAGRIRWGMLYLDPDTLRFKIEQKTVDEHIGELQKQLAAKESVFEWVQAWNAYANTFFASNFGKAANCFGREHVDEILATHRRIQKSVFDGKDVAQYVKSMIEERFGIHNVADGFLFFPIELGGLELQSPFISPLQIRNSVAESPSKILDEFENNERDDFRERKADFDRGKDPEGREDVDDPNWKPSEGADEFMPFEEYIKYREEFNTVDTPNHLLMAYNELMETPAECSIEASEAVLQAIRRLSPHAHIKFGPPRGITDNWSEMSAYWKWMAQLYGSEMIERFGGLSVVESGLLPIGMVGLFRDQKVKWQG